MKPTEFINVVDTADLRAFQHQARCELADRKGMITAWTHLTPDAWEILNTQGILRCPRNLSMPEFASSYEWMVSVMDEMGLHAPAPGINPLWCWLNAGHKNRKPKGEMRDPSAYLCTFRMKPERVLISDFHYWHFCLNYWPIAISERFSEQLDTYFENHGLNYYRQNPLPTPHHELIQGSWRNIFNLDFTYSGESPVPFHEKVIQGVFWELSLSDIIHVEAPTKNSIY